MATHLMDVRHSDEILRQIRPTSRGKTSYTSMSEWLHKPGRTVPTEKPVLRSRNEWRPVPTREMVEKAALNAAETHLRPEDSDPIRGTDQSFQQKYNSLTNQIAYRWPNPGSPRAREGGIGGTWRHIKEVLCHGGSRTCFVDGLVSVYDSEKFTEELQANLSRRPHVKAQSKLPPIPPVAPSKVTTSYQASFAPYAVLPDLPFKTEDQYRRKRPGHRGQ